MSQLCIFSPSHAKSVCIDKEGSSLFQPLDKSSTKRRSHDLGNRKDLEDLESYSKFRVQCKGIRPNKPRPPISPQLPTTPVASPTAPDITPLKESRFLRILEIKERELDLFYSGC